MTSYSISLQAKHWKFTADDLRRIRAETNAAARRKVQHAKSSVSESMLLTPLEEEQVLRFFQRKVFAICDHLKRPPNVSAAAIAFMQRFYLRHSVMLYSLKSVMLAAIFVATKVEESRVELRDLIGTVADITDVEAFKQTQNDALAVEIPLLNGIRFHLTIYNAFMPLAGFVKKLQQSIADVDWTSVSQTANTILQQAVLTDVMLLFPPGIVALAALWLSAGKHQLSQDIAYGWLAALFGVGAVAGVHEQVTEAVKVIAAVTREPVKEIQQKLEAINAAM
eukprot:TRINITY_DN3336_c0_g1_i1.p1 TRINITY_DN3336_c0_g1~~TRINITY_DN3336_c0_g1_i1.p1  ORF type:complete len:280 (+),score=67.04 TRINITY_DN3336_c0_g1_i1:1-840(+)